MDEGAQDCEPSSPPDFDAPGAPGRTALGPRPLAAHLAAGAVDLSQGAALALGAGDARFPWRASLREEGEALGARMGELNPHRLGRAIAEAGLRDLAAALKGMRRSHREPPVRRPPDPPILWRSGSTQLFDYAPDRPEAPAVLVLPSLINGWRILDLTRSRSLMRGLAERGLRPFLLEWGEPRGEERSFAVADYAEQRLAPAIEAAAQTLGASRGGRLALVGHCMSGAIAAAGAQLATERIDRLVLLAAPWRFAPMRPPRRATPKRSELEQLISACGAVFGGVPADLLDTLFFLRDPLQAMRKFPAFGGRATRRAPDRLFIAVEDWLNEGRRLAAPTARTLFVEWGLDDSLSRGRWRVADRRVTLAEFGGPTLIVTSRSDTVVPDASAEGAFRAARNAEIIHTSAGHVGMIVGRRAERELWDPLAEFCGRPI